jgi:hypothetical protein
MAIFGSIRDIKTFKGVSKELLENVISQQCGYYKIVLRDTPKNIYGESSQKFYVGPVLINCLIERGDFSFDQSDFGPDSKRTVTFRYLKDHLVEANVVPEVGDVVFYNEYFYQVDNVNENQQILGKDPDYTYSSGLENFGSSYSIILTCHFASPDALGITKQRL